MSTETAPLFSQLGLAAPVLQAVDEVGYEAPSPIQAEAIPPLLARRDLLGQAQTGTGKTAAFALPLLSLLDLSSKEPQILVLTPTRELAIQVAEAMQTYARHLKGFHVLPVYGGQSIDGQLRQLRRGVHAVVGTPGRIQDHLRRRTLKLDRLTTVVLDEADEMLRMGFLEDVEQILEHTPSEKQVALFSATMPAQIRKVAQKYLRDPVEIRIKTKTATVATVTQRYWRVMGVHKLDALTRILEVEDFEAMLVFVRTKVATVELAEKLEARGFACSPLNGDMNQALRERTVERLKKGRLDIVVATDVAARGLDVERISHVVNFDIPYDVEAYVHRIGRTGRAGREGQAILFVASRERHMLQAIERATRQPIEKMHLPSREDIAERRVARFKETLTNAIQSQELDFFEKMIEGYREENEADLGEIAAALAYLAQRDRPLLPMFSRDQEQPRERDRPAAKPSRAGGEHRGIFEGGRSFKPQGSSTDFGSSAKAEVQAPRAALPHKRTLPPGGPKERFEGPDVSSRSTGVPMESFRIEVGRDHGVEPKNVVGAIANEAGLEGDYIGHIRLFDSFCTVDLPKGMPRETFEHLKTVKVCGEELRITRISRESRLSARGPKPFKGGKKKFKSKKKGKKFR
jgi:ATP-dependent RNA helicase DeaD